MKCKEKDRVNMSNKVTEIQMKGISARRCKKNRDTRNEEDNSRPEDLTNYSRTNQIAREFMKCRSKSENGRIPQKGFFKSNSHQGDVYADIFAYNF